MSDIPGLIATASEAAREAGEFLATRFADARIVTEMRRDVKLSEDSEAEAIIVERLRRTGLPILAEESAEMTNALDLDLVWIVDPLDGSYNYNRGFDRCVVAIGLLAKGRPVGGVIFDFLRNDLLAGGPGFGAVCNGRPMRVSGVREAADAALVTGLPANRDFSASWPVTRKCACSVRLRVRWRWSLAGFSTSITNRTSCCGMWPPAQPWSRQRAAPC
jgi:myo-inositol-1(or 4)-monophosphatase